MRKFVEKFSMIILDHEKKKLQDEDNLIDHYKVDKNVRKKGKHSVKQRGSRLRV